MAPVMEMVLEHESLRTAGTRSRVLIAAATAALVGSRFRILEIRPAESRLRDLEKRRPLLETGHARLLRQTSGPARRPPERRSKVRLRITLEDGTYDVGVEVLAETEAAWMEDFPPAAVPDSVLQPPRPLDTRPEDRICRSPIAGLVAAVEVFPRQRVRQDDPLVTIEAMKMLNTIGAPMSGVIEEVLVKRGDAVKSGQVLCTLS
ncbi:MAG TPA: biotin/lipoyl-containing protein [Bryobacteraceae bacterium]|nr:biotin/lipoyl-containing protein [Bryobacteraceae bacterium]